MKEKKGLSFNIWIGLLSLAGLALYVYANREIVSTVFLAEDFTAYLGRGLICGTTGFFWSPLIGFLKALFTVLAFVVALAIVAFFFAYIIFGFTFQDALKAVSAL
ncbi:MAG: hypothetical protein AABW50_04250 [Nanoarchaeota archaeon]